MYVNFIKCMVITIEAMKMIRGEAALNGGSRTKEMVLFGLFTALIAIGAFIKIPVPVCPFTLQLLFTTLAGLILGSRNGACSGGLYVLWGLRGCLSLRRAVVPRIFSSRRLDTSSDLLRGRG